MFSKYRDHDTLTFIPEKKQCNKATKKNPNKFQLVLLLIISFYSMIPVRTTSSCYSTSKK